MSVNARDRAEVNGEVQGVATSHLIHHGVMDMGSGPVTAQRSGAAADS